MEKIIELILSLLLALGVGVPPGSGFPPDVPETGSEAPAHVEALVAAAHDRASAATERARAVVAWAACVAEAAATAGVPRGEDFDPRLGCGPLPAAPAGGLNDGDRSDVPPVDIPAGPPTDVPPVVVPAGPPAEVPPVDIPVEIPAEVPPVEIPAELPSLPVEIPDLP